MTGTARVFTAELLRLARSRSTLVVLLVLAAGAALRTTVAIGWTAAERGGAADPLSSGAAWAPFVDGWRVGLVLATLALLAHAARSVAGDREGGVLRLAVTRSAGRGALVAGRLALAPLAILASVLATGAAAWVVAARAGDFGPLVEDGYEILSAAELRAEVRRSALAVLPGMLATIAFGLFVSCFARSAAVAVVVAVGCFLAFDLFKEALGDAQALVFAAHVPSLADTSAFGELGGFARGYSDAGYSAALERAAHIVSWPAALAFALLAWAVLSRRRL